MWWLPCSSVPVWNDNGGRIDMQEKNPITDQPCECDNLPSMSSRSNRCDLPDKEVPEAFQPQKEKKKKKEKDLHKCNHKCLATHPLKLRIYQPVTCWWRHASHQLREPPAPACDLPWWPCPLASIRQSTAESSPRTIDDCKHW